MWHDKEQAINAELNPFVVTVDILIWMNNGRNQKIKDRNGIVSYQFRTVTIVLFRIGPDLNLLELEVCKNKVYNLINNYSELTSLNKFKIYKMALGTDINDWESNSNIQFRLCI